MMLLNNLNRNLNRPGQADALGLLGAYLMAAGGPQTDPSASGRLLAEGTAQYQNALRQAKLDVGNAQMRDLRRQEVEGRISDRQRAAANRAKLTRALQGTPQGEAFDTGVMPTAGGMANAPAKGLLAGDPVLQAVAGADPMAAVSGLLAQRRADTAARARQAPKSPEQIAQTKDLIRFREGVKAKTKPPSTRYQNAGPYVNAQGEFAGEGVFDRQTGTTMLRTANGEMTPMPPGMVPRTEGGLQRNIMTGEQFRKLATEVNAEERSMRALVRYAGRVKDTGQGLDLIADQLFGQFKTIFGKENLTREELNTLAQTGELQRLIGGFRKEVVGGGVMTEQDALRVIYALGGNISALRNKEVARQLLGQMFQDKARNYNEVLMPVYNEQITSTRRGFFKPKEAVSLSDDAFAASRSTGDVPDGVTPEEWGAMTPEERSLWLK